MAFIVFFQQMLNRIEILTASMLLSIFGASLEPLAPLIS
jgi:hypothetical protein